MIMLATVLQVNPQSLLVRNEENGEEVLVHTQRAGSFSENDRVAITYNGQMTFSIPPQISAFFIQRLPPIFPSPAPPTLPVPSEMRAVVLQTGDGFLIVRNAQNRRQFRVEYAHAHHFCPRQLVLVSYDTVTMGNPPAVTATDILPLC